MSIGVFDDITQQSCAQRYAGAQGDCIRRFRSTLTSSGPLPVSRSTALASFWSWL